MNILKATKRNTESTGQINKLRSEGFIPAVLYGGKKNNLNISLKKLNLQNILNTERLDDDDKMQNNRCLAGVLRPANTKRTDQDPARRRHE